MGNRKTMARLGAALAVVAVAVTVFFLRPAADAPASGGAGVETAVVAGLPRLLDLGADKCIPCKMMAPILDELKAEFTESFSVEFIDVWKNPDAAQPFGAKVIPTQIFFSADGTELFRHEGFFSREDILAKWRELGIAIPVKDA